MGFVALRILLADRAKLVAIIVGLTFAAMIMAQQPAMMLGMMAQTYAFIDDVGGVDVWVMNPAVESIDDHKPMPDGALHRVRGVTGVAQATPLFKGVVMSKLPDGDLVGVELVGVDDVSLVGLPTTHATRERGIRHPDGAFVQASATGGQLAWSRHGGEPEPLRVGDELEVNDHRLKVVGLVQTATTLIDLPTIYTTFSRATEIGPSTRNRLSFVLVRLEPESAPEAVARRITAATGLAALTTEDFRERTEAYYWEATGIPFTFGMVTALGFLVGAAIAGQSLFVFTRDNLRHFATLEALGVTHLGIVGLVLLQGLAVGLCGWGTGVGLAALSGIAMQGGDIGFVLTWKLLAASALGVAVIVVVGSAGSLWTVLRAEPGIVFHA